MRAKALAFAALALLFTIAPAAAQPPRVTNGRVTTQPAASGLEAAFRRLVSTQSDAGWIGYLVPAVHRSDSNRWSGDTWISDGLVFTNGRLATCSLEPSTQRRTPDQPATLQNPVKLEGPDALVVLYRVENRTVQRIRSVSNDCELDAGGLSLQWLDAVNSAESIKLLSTFVSTTAVKSDRLTEAAVGAIALHRDAAADAELERLAAVSYPEFVRRKATFWMGVARGSRGFEMVKKIAHDDPSVDVRKSAMSALAQSGDDQAIPELIRFARNDASPAVRGEALFWLAQKAGQRAASEITAAIERDPDTEVKKRAVFALSQLPKDEGVPLLINVAKSNQNPVVRKQAMFWLGQSKDPRAIEFFAQILAK